MDQKAWEDLNFDQMRERYLANFNNQKVEEIPPVEQEPEKQEEAKQEEVPPLEEIPAPEENSVDDSSQTQNESKKGDLDGTQTNDDTFSQYSDRSMVEAAHRLTLEAIQRLNEEVDENVIYLKDEEEKRPILTRAYLENMCKTNQKTYYQCPEVNDLLYLNNKNFKYIRNMEMFPNLKCLYFNVNGCKSLSGLENCSKLLTLYLQDNCISKMTGLENLVQLTQLNLSDNFIGEVTGLQNCVNLNSLTLTRNQIGWQKDCKNVDAIKGVLECPSIETLDIQHNFLTDPIVIDEVFVKMQNLTVFQAKGNEFIRHVNQYKRLMIVKCPELGYLEDSPVFEDTKRIAHAYFRGQDVGQAQKAITEEREQIRDEKKEKRSKGAAMFQEMVRKARSDKQEFENMKKNKMIKQEGMSLQEMLAEAKKLKKEAELTLRKPDPKDEREKTLRMIYVGDAKRYQRVDKAQVDLENAEKKIEELNKKIQAEEDKKQKEMQKKADQDKIEQQKKEEQDRIKMYERLMNSNKTVSAEEVAKFREIYDEYDEEESAAILLLNKENMSTNQSTQETKQSTQAPSPQEQKQQLEKETVAPSSAKLTNLVKKEEQELLQTFIDQVKPKEEPNHLEELD